MRRVAQSDSIEAVAPERVRVLVLIVRTVQPTRTTPQTAVSLIRAPTRRVSRIVVSETIEAVAPERVRVRALPARDLVQTSTGSRLED